MLRPRVKRSKSRGYKHRKLDRSGGDNPGPLAVLLLALVLAAAVAIGGTQSSGRSDDPPLVEGEHEVARVFDGDTVALTDGRRVRLAQIDTPELSLNECFAEAARNTLTSLLPVGTRIRLRRDRALGNTDRYGRLIRYVVARRANVNVQMVRRGAASVWFVDGDHGRHAKRLIRAARRARRSRAGLWRTCPGTRFDTSHGVQTDVRRR